MLLTKEIRLFNKNIPIENISLKSHKKVEVKCDNCGTVKMITYQSYNNSTNNNKFKYYCNNKDCINKKRNMVIQEKYGVDNVSKLESVKIKKIETCLKNFGVEHPFQSDEIKEKSSRTVMNKYGTKWHTQSKNFKEKSKQTNLKKYGFECANKSEIIQSKTKKTCSDKYNFEFYIKSDEFKEKSKKTNIEKYGTEKPQLNSYIINKTKNTNLEKYGVEYPSQSDEIKNKIKTASINNFKDINKSIDIKNKMKESCLEKYNSEHYSQSEFYKCIVKNRKIKLLSEKYKLEISDIDNGIITSICDKCNQKFEANYQLLYNRFIYNKPLCTICNPVDSLSASEVEVKNFIMKNYTGEVLLNNRNIIKPYELDIYLPDLKLAFEFNGLFWHSEVYKDKEYHYNKTEMCERIGIQLINIYEDDWSHKQDIVKSIILNKLGKFSDKIYARKCDIKIINNNKLIKEFLNKNHIQGYISSEFKIGLFYNNEIVSLLTLGKKRKIMSSTSDNYNYEIYRFCNRLNTTVIGGLSKLFNYVIKNFNFLTIISYVDRSYFNGNNYLKIGFKMDSKTQPNYYYIINGKKEYRLKFRKDILVKEGFDKYKTEHQIMLDRGFFRIYNSGNYKMIYKKE